MGSPSSQTLGSKSSSGTCQGNHFTLLGTPLFTLKMIWFQKETNKGRYKRQAYLENLVAGLALLC